MAYRSKYSIEDFNNAVNVVNNCWLVLKVEGLDANSSISVAYNTTILTGVCDSQGEIYFDLPSYGTWTVTGVVEGNTITDTQQVNALKIYTVDMSTVNDN